MDWWPASGCIGVYLLIASCVPASLSAGQLNIVQIYRARRQLSSDSASGLTRTSFSCDVHGPGYFADVQTDCQMFHVCHAQFMDSFLCPAGTRFNQKTFVCDWKWSVDCGASPRFFALNNRIGSLEPFLTSADDTATSRPGGGASETRALRSDQQSGLLAAAEVIGRHSDSLSQISIVDSRQSGDIASVNSGKGRGAGSLERSDAVGRRRNTFGLLGRSEQVGSGAILLPNTLTVEEPSFFGLDLTSRPPSPLPAPPVSGSASLASVVVNGPVADVRPQSYRGQEAELNQQRNSGYLPSTNAKPSSGAYYGSSAEQKGTNYLLEAPDNNNVAAGPQKANYLPLEDTRGTAGEGGNLGASRNRYTPLNIGLPAIDVALSRVRLEDTRGTAAEGGNLGTSRNRYTPLNIGLPATDTAPSRSIYLPESSSVLSDSRRLSSSNDREAFIADVPAGGDEQGGLLPPSLPFTDAGAFPGRPLQDEYAPVAEGPPALPPLNLLPLSNEAAPADDARLPSTTPSYGVLNPWEESQQLLSEAQHIADVVADTGRNNVAGAKSDNRGVQAATLPATPIIVKAQQTRTPIHKFNRPAQQEVQRTVSRDNVPTRNKAPVDKIIRRERPEPGQPPKVGTVPILTTPAPRVKDAQTSASAVESGPSLAPSSPVSSRPRDQFQYSLDAILRRLQQRLQGVEPYNVPAAETRRAESLPAAGRASPDRSGGVPPSPYLYSLPLLLPVSAETA